MVLKICVEQSGSLLYLAPLTLSSVWVSKSNSYLRMFDKNRYPVYSNPTDTTTNKYLELGKYT
jgi:hypothetical protein